MTTPSPEDEPGLPDLPSSDGKPDELFLADEDNRDDESIDAELVEDRKVEHIVNLVVAQVENKLEQHLHTQMELPPADQAAELRDKAPEVYHAWIDIARQKAETEAFVQRAQYEVPQRLARTGRPWAFAALVSVLVFCAYVASLGGSGIYIAGIVSAIDLVTMLGLFMGARPELMERQSRNKREDDSEKPEALPSNESE